MTHRLVLMGVTCAVAVAALSAGQSQAPGRRPIVAPVPVPAAEVPVVLDKAGEKWVADTFKKMTLDDKVGQLVMSAIDSMYLSSDTEQFDRLLEKVKVLKLGGFVVFGGSERAPGVLLNNAYGTVTLGQPLAAASTLNRLQAAAGIPLLAAADFEAGAGFRIAGATAFPRAMAFGAAADEELTRAAAVVTGQEGRAIGVHLNLAPVADVNNNPRNPVINTRAFGEVPADVGRLNAAYIQGLRAGGMLSTLKHFPGHGDTDTDSHIGLPIITHPRDRLDAVELSSFKAGIAAGADAIMTAHIQLPALDPAEFSPTTLSRPIVTGLLRGELKFNGLIVTDSMGMDAVSKRLTPGEAAARAILAGNDVVLHSPDDAAAVAGIKAAVERGDIAMAQIDASVRRVLRSKARLGLHKKKIVSLDDLPFLVGGRQRAQVARDVSQRSVTLLKDDRNQVPLRVPRESAVLYLSVLDYPSGWRIAAPSRTVIPELRRRWPSVTAIELSDRSTPSEIDLVRATALRYDAIVVSVFVRASSGSGRMDLAPPVTKLLTDLARLTASTPKPFVAMFFGNPYVPMFLPELPAVLLTYDFYDLAEASAVSALAGDTAIGGRLPISLPGMYTAGFGLVRDKVARRP
ncbi:MAG: glycoside hydrolase family 3 protein [Acidobacteria bacterium]|nr:glycoside hydrolase family 3 protein [Acidobacteriota bacterium]